MDAEKRKVYQARSHLLKAEILLKSFSVQKQASSIEIPADTIRSIEAARKSLYNYTLARWGKINLESYK